MPKQGSDLIKFLKDALEKKTFVNLEYEDETNGIFSLYFPRKTEKLDIAHQLILREWAKIKNRQYEGINSYSSERHVLQAALKKSTFLGSLPKHGKKLRYKILAKDEIKERKNQAVSAQMENVMQVHSGSDIVNNVDNIDEIVSDEIPGVPSVTTSDYRSTEDSPGSVSTHEDAMEVAHVTPLEKYYLNEESAVENRLNASSIMYNDTWLGSKDTDVPSMSDEPDDHTDLSIYGSYHRDPESEEKHDIIEDLPFQDIHSYGGLETADRSLEQFNLMNQEWKNQTVSSQMENVIQIQSDSDIVSNVDNIDEIVSDDEIPKVPSVTSSGCDTAEDSPGSVCTHEDAMEVAHMTLNEKSDAENHPKPLSVIDNDTGFGSKDTDDVPRMSDKPNNLIKSSFSSDPFEASWILYADENILYPKSDEKQDIVRYPHLHHLQSYDSVQLNSVEKSVVDSSLQQFNQMNPE